MSKLLFGWSVGCSLFGPYPRPNSPNLLVILAQNSPVTRLRSPKGAFVGQDCDAHECAQESQGFPKGASFHFGPIICLVPKVQSEEMDPNKCITASGGTQVLRYAMLQGSNSRRPRHETQKPHNLIILQTSRRLCHSLVRLPRL